jgi:hypothetical protein
MSCLERIKVNLVTHEIFLKTSHLYNEMGKNYFYRNLFKQDLAHIKQKIVQQNAESFFKLCFKDFTIRENRYRTLLLESSTPNNKSEKLYLNLVKVFEKIHLEKSEPFDLYLGEIQDLTHLLFADVLSSNQLKYRKVGKKKGFLMMENISVREELELYLDKFVKVQKKHEIEPIFLYVNFFVDFMNLNVYQNEYNDSLALLIFYTLMVENDCSAADYISFFQKLLVYKDEYLEIINLIKIQSQQDSPDLMPLMRFFINIFNSMYVDLNEFSRDYEYDQNLSINKTDYVENTIYKLPEVFSKADIRKHHPSVSDSTINRTLKRLQDDNIIRSVGTGRGAKWVKIAKKTDKIKFEGQFRMDLGDEYE